MVQYYYNRIRGFEPIVVKFKFLDKNVRAHAFTSVLSVEKYYRNATLLRLGVPTLLPYIIIIIYV